MTVTDSYGTLASCARDFPPVSILCEQTSILCEQTNAHLVLLVLWVLFLMVAAGSDKATTRSGRTECYRARDAFYQCVRESGLLYSSKTPIPSKCKQLRAAFESSCLASWVKHFDELQEAQARAARNLHNAINSKAATAAGNLAGTSQQQ